MAQRAASGAQGRTNRRFLLVAILLAGLSAALVYAKISANDTTHSTTVAAGDQQVVVAKIPIKERTTITAAMLEVKSVPLNSVALGAFTGVVGAVGRVAIRRYLECGKLHRLIFGARLGGGGGLGVRAGGRGGHENKTGAGKG